MEANPATFNTLISNFDKIGASQSPLDSVLRTFEASTWAELIPSDITLTLPYALSDLDSLKRYGEK